MNSKQTIKYFHAIGKLQPPCIRKNNGWTLGYYFAVDSDELRIKLMDEGGGKFHFDTYDAGGLFWWVYRSGCGGQTPFSFEKIGFVVEKFSVE